MIAMPLSLPLYKFYSKRNYKSHSFSSVILDYRCLSTVRIKLVRLLVENLVKPTRLENSRHFLL